MFGQSAVRRRRLSHRSLQGWAHTVPACPASGVGRARWRISGLADAANDARARFEALATQLTSTRNVYCDPGLLGVAAAPRPGANRRQWLVGMTADQLFSAMTGPSFCSTLAACFSPVLAIALMTASSSEGVGYWARKTAFLFRLRYPKAATMLEGLAVPERRTGICQRKVCMCAVRESCL